MASPAWLGGFGLAGMKERTEVLGGKLLVEAERGWGTKMTAILPFRQGGWRTMYKIRLLLVDDHTMFRKGLREILDGQRDMIVVGEAKDGKEAMRRAEELAPDIILMDISMPVLDGIKATRLITARDEGAVIIMLTMYAEDAYVFEAIKAGAKGYIPKDADLGELLEAIRSVHRGEPIIDSRIAGRVLMEFCRPTRGQKREDGLDLSKREQEILQLVAQGLTNKEIAAQLFLSEYTIKKALSITFQKLHVNTRTGAVVHALREGLLKPE